MANFDLTPTAEELEAMQRGSPMAAPCTTPRPMAAPPAPPWRITSATIRKLGLTAEGVKGSSDVEALGTDQADAADRH